MLAGCGGSSGGPTISDVEKAVGVRNPDSSEVRCERHGELEGKAVFRCRLDMPTSTREMRPESSCYTFERGRLENVTRHVSC